MKGVPTISPAEETAWARGLSAAAELGSPDLKLREIPENRGSAAVPTSRALTVPITRTHVGPAPWSLNFLIRLAPRKRSTS